MRKHTPEEKAFALRVTSAALALFRKEVERTEDAVWRFTKSLDALSPETREAIREALKTETS